MKAVFVLTLASVLISSACGLADGGLFDPPAEVKQAALLKCKVSPLMPTCTDPASEASLPVWERAAISQGAVDCINALGCSEADDIDATRNAAEDCIASNQRERPSETLSDAETSARLQCVGDCIDAYDTAVCTNGSELGAATDDFDTCRDDC